MPNGMSGPVKTAERPVPGQQSYGAGKLPGNRGGDQYEGAGVESTYFTEGRFDMYRDDLQNIRDREAGIDERWKDEYNTFQEQMDQSYGNMYDRQRAEAGAAGYNAGNLRMANQGIGGMRMQQAQQADMLQRQMQQGNSMDDYLRSQTGMDQIMGMHGMGAQANQLAAQQKMSRDEKMRADAERWKRKMDNEEAAAASAAGTGTAAAGAAL